ncbi:MAG: regulatory protein RecX [Trichlorobacter sp.]
MRSTATESADQAYLAALKLLAGRDYTLAALACKLEQRGYQHQQVAETLVRLSAEHFLDDRRYAERFISQARESGRYVGYRLRQELKRRGVPTELAAELLEGCCDRAAELALARQVLSRRYAGFDPAASDDRVRRRVAGFLQRRGFGCEVIRQLLDRRRPCDECI